MPQPWRNVWPAKKTMKETQTLRLRKTWSLLPGSVKSRQETLNVWPCRMAGLSAYTPLSTHGMLTTVFLPITPRCSSAGPTWYPT